MKIFIIEDESAIRVELSQFLLKYGYECESSENFQDIGNEALNRGIPAYSMDRCVQGVE